MRFTPILSSMKLVLAALILAVGLAANAAPADPNSLYSRLGADISNEGIGSAFTLVDPTGHRRSVSDFRGKVVTVFFGYTQCPDVCPTSLLMMADVMKILDGNADRVQVLFVTVDPQRDTPELLGQYVPQFDSRFVGLWGEKAELDAITKSFRVTYEVRPGKTPTTYTIDHTAGMYVFDPQGRLRLLIRHGERPEKVAHDLELLLGGA